jgi:hypothetical protein
VSCHFEGSLITDARCRCRMLERELIPCAHIFTVLSNSRVESIPPFCVMDYESERHFPTGESNQRRCNSFMTCETRVIMLYLKRLDLRKVRSV